MFPFRPKHRGPFDQPRGPYPEPDNPGFPSGLPPAPPPAGGERTRAVHQSRDRSRPRSPVPEPQLIHIPIGDGSGSGILWECQYREEANSA